MAGASWTVVRLILDEPMAAAANMARDAALLAEGIPTVRLYGWKPAAVSLGRAQTEADIDMGLAKEWGLDVVRRETGGGAILHNESEVTYSVTLPLDYPGLPRDITGSFVFVSRGVVEALRLLGIPAEIESVPDNTRDTLCYVRKQGTNVVVPFSPGAISQRGISPLTRESAGVQGGLSPLARKISGGAQRRNGSHFLQHGTVIVDRDEERMARLFGSDVGEISSRVTSLSEEGVRVSRPELVEALVAGFGKALGPFEA